MRRDHHLTGDESLADELAIRRNYLRSIGVTPASRLQKARRAT